MKTQIIRLEPHDDFISARDKMGWSKAGRILMVWPERGRILYREVDLILLKRHSTILGAQLAFVTRDADVRYYAHLLAIPVYKDLPQAQRSHWRVDRVHRRQSSPKKPMPGKPRPDIYTLRALAHPAIPSWQNSAFFRLGIFTLGVLALLSIAAVIFPSAEIKLSPEIQTQQIDLEVRANPMLDTINLAGTIPAKLLVTSVKGTDSIPSTGATRIPDKYASTRLQFTNLTNERIKIPQNTVVRTSGDHPVRFSTIRSGEVAAGPGQTVIILAQSIEPGESGNLPASSLSIIEGLFGTRLAVTNLNPALGGSNRSAPAPTAYQRQQLLDQLTTKLGETALLELEKQVSSGDLLLPATLTQTQVLQEKFDPAEIQPADTLNLDLDLEFQATYVSDKDLKALANGVLDANLPQGFVSIPDSLTIQQMSDPVIGEDGFAHWQIRSRRQIQADIPKSKVVGAVLGASPSQAYQRLVDTLSLDESPYLRLRPSWWPRMPYLPFRVTVQVTPNNP